MGYVEIIKNGQLTRMNGGEVIFTSKTFICDSCETEQAEFGSEIVSSQGLMLIQFCENCKGMSKSDKFKRVHDIKVARS